MVFGTNLFIKLHYYSHDSILFALGHKWLMMIVFVITSACKGNLAVLRSGLAREDPKNIYKRV
jgi:hypothetical protein